MARKRSSTKRENRIIMCCVAAMVLLVGFAAYQLIRKPNTNYGLEDLQTFLIANGYGMTEIYRNECGRAAAKFDTRVVCSDRLSIDITDTEEVINEHLYDLIELTNEQRVFAVQDDLRTSTRTNSSNTHTGSILLSQRNNRECSMAINVNHIVLKYGDPAVHSINYDVFCSVSK